MGVGFVDFRVWRVRVMDLGFRAWGVGQWRVWPSGLGLKREWGSGFP